jgi:hypothetical protein
VETLLNGVAQIDPRPLGNVLADLDPNSRRLVAALPENIERTFELADMVRSGRDHPSVFAQLAAESQLAVHGLVILLTTLQLRSVPNH